MKRIICVVECFDWAAYEQADTPNLDRLDPHPAISYGTTTGAAAGAISRGFTPICVNDDCDQGHNDIGWQDPWFLDELDKQTNLLTYTANGWNFASFEPFMGDLRDKCYDWHNRHEECPSREMLDDFEQRDLDDYAAIYWVQESHPPFFHPDWSHLSAGDIDSSDETPEPPERRRKAIEWIDENIIGRLLEFNYDELLVCGDHPMSHPGDPREYVQDLEESSDPEEYQVVLATNDVTRQATPTDEERENIRNHLRDLGYKL